MTNFKVKKILNFIDPHPQIGGLEITDSNISFILIKDGKVDFMSTKIPPGILVDGKIKDKEKFLSLLQVLKNKISPEKNKKVYIVVNISDGSVYSEILSIPKSASVNLKETVKLNMQMISPIDFANSYSDWQLLGEKVENNTTQLEIFSVFIAKQHIDDLESVLEKAGFNIIAVEFSSLALVRSICDLDENISKDKKYLLFKVGGDGLSFGFIQNKNLYFLHFVSWASIYGDSRNVTLDSLKKFIVEEMQKIISFHETHYGGQIDNLLLVSPTLTDEIFKIVSESYPNLFPVVPKLKGFNDLTLSWYSVLGSAIRGTINRSKDTIVSLASKGTEEKFKSYQIMSFINIWRNVILSFLGVMIVVLLGFDIFLINKESSADSQIKELAVHPDLGALMALEKDANNFNKKVDTIYNGRLSQTHLNQTIQELKTVAGNDINIIHLSISTPDQPVYMKGQAPSEESVFAFEKSLEINPKFSDINFQIANIIPTGNNQFNFDISFKYKR